MATSVDDVTEAMKDVVDPELGISCRPRAYLRCDG
jgi:metal-sulfur cluster biosynthetic enzyme